uniref:Carotenoid cleavage dioxygenase 7, chloroplastic n=1 Tax=Anthurium amnicola TaxID=1678845 RepID=A0A1D1YEE4_9ARAE
MQTAQHRLPTAPVRPPPPPRKHRSTRISSSVPVTTPIAPSPPPAVPAITRIRRIPTVDPVTITRPTPTYPSDTDSVAAAFWDYQSLFVSQRREAAYPVPLRTVDGAVPADFPAGTYYLAGPGIFADDHGSTVHPLDGHGYLRAFDFGAGGRGVRYSARYVATGARREERDEETGGWRFTHRGPFSVLKAGRKVGNMKVMKNVANTSVLVWGGRLLCLWEGGDPYELHPETLDTVGLFDVVGPGMASERRSGEGETAGGRGCSPHRPGRVHRLGELGLDAAAALLKPVLHGVFKMPPKRLLSHYRIDARRNRLLMLSCNSEDMLLPRSHFTFYEFDSSFRLLQKKDFTIPDHLMIHDWAFTEDHYILVGNRIKLDVPGSLRAVSGHSPMISSLSVNPSRPTSPIYLLPRFSDGTGAGGSRRDWRVPIEAPGQLWVLHVGNAFERRDEEGEVEFQLQASACSYHWFNFQKMFGYDWQSGKLDPSFMNVRKGQQSLLPHLVNVSIRMDADGNCRQCSVREASDRWSKPADFPAINPAFSGSPNKYVYAGTTSGSRRFLPHFPFDSVAKLDSSDGAVAAWSAGRRRFVGEPMFVPRRGSTMGEDDGYILVVEYAVCKSRCYLVILDARSIGRGDAVVARMEVPKHLNFPLGFHGFWAGRT